MQHFHMDVAIKGQKHHSSQRDSLQDGRTHVQCPLHCLGLVISQVLFCPPYSHHFCLYPSGQTSSKYPNIWTSQWLLYVSYFYDDPAQQ